MQTAEKMSKRISSQEVHICPQLGRAVLFRKGKCLSSADCPRPEDCPFLPAWDDVQDP